MKRKILFLNYTEVQFLLSFLYFKLYFKSSEWEAHFALLNSNKQRFNNLNLSTIEATFYNYKNDLNFIKIIKPDKEFLKLYNIGIVDRIVFSNPAYFINYSLINYFYKKNKELKTTIISDGIGFFVYESFKYRLIAAIKLFIRKRINGIPNLSNFIWKYSGLIKNSHVDTVISNSNVPEGDHIYINSDELLMKGVESIPELKSIFNMGNQFEVINIIYFSQGVDELIPSLKGEINNLNEFIFSFCNKHNKKILIKPHPSENHQKYQKYINSNIILYTNNNLPGEMLIKFYPNSISMSLYSSVGYINNSNAKVHYWLFPMLNLGVHNNINIIGGLNEALKAKNNIVKIENKNELEKILLEA